MDIKALRLAKNMTQKELADLVGVSIGTISRYESGQVIPPTNRLISMLNILVPPCDTLMNESSEVSRLMAYAPSVQSSQSYLDRIILLGANGHCELCKKEAPFVDKEGRPYLEVLKIERLAVGINPIKNRVALCPNCHRKITVLRDPSDIEQLKKIAANHNY